MTVLDISPVERALNYARQGFEVFPLRGKLPAISKDDGGNGVHDATTDEAAIRDMWSRYPTANIGLAAGERSGFWVLDIDTAKGGRDSLEALIAEQGPLPKTVMQETGSGGYHLLFKWPEGKDIRNRANNIAKGLDTRSTGGYIVVSPSLHPDTGKPYRWAAGRALGEAEILPAPEWLIDLASPPVEPPTVYSAPMTAPSGDYARAALVKECEAIKSAGNGDQEAALNKASFSIGQLVGSGALSRGEAEPALIGAGLSMPSYDPRRKWTHRDIEVKVKRGLDDGAREPRHVPERPVVPVGAAAPTSQPVEWPAPDMSIIELRRRKPPVLPVDVFGPVWADWIKATAEQANAPVDYIAGGLLPCAASMYGGARRIELLDTSWQEPAFLNVGIVGDPSTRKTPSLRPLMKLARSVEKNWNSDFDSRVKEYKEAKEIGEASLAVWRSEVQAATKEAKTAPPMPDVDIPAPPQPKQVIIDSTTLEALEQTLAANPKGALVFADELPGFFGNMKRYSGGDDRPFYVKAWNGDPHTSNKVKFAGKRLEIECAGLSILGGIQPDRFDELTRERNDGFLARFIWLFPECPPRRLPKLSADNSFALTAFERLASLDYVNVGEGELLPIVLPLSKADGAFDIFADWWKQNEADIKAAPGLVSDHFGKLDGICGRIALNLELFTWAASGGAEPTVISKQSVWNACRLVDTYLKPMAFRVYGDVSRGEEDHDAAALGKAILKSGLSEFNSRELFRNDCPPGLTNAGRMKKAVGRLIDAGWLEEKPSPPARGRKRVDYLVNPRVHEMGAGHE